jgi:hypothetical protein
LSLEVALNIFALNFLFNFEDLSLTSLVPLCWVDSCFSMDYYIVGGFLFLNELLYCVPVCN